MNVIQPDVVAIFNTSPDTVEMLRIVIEREGFVVVSAFTYDLRDAVVDLEAFVRQHHPRVVVYDIAPPYQENWRLFQHICSLHELRRTRFVVTTTNIEQLRKVAGAEQRELYEFVGKPYDLGLIAAAVKQRIGE
ncbi:MAG: hypothetical protein H0T71_06750 [Acidobacteria bacterium]|nr:hypothetical protein [Acidobacteriota bacterium]